MPTYTGQREQELAKRVRRMLVEQAAILQDESPDEFLWLTQHYTTEQRFFEDELGARLLADRAPPARIARRRCL